MEINKGTELNRLRNNNTWVSCLRIIMCIAVIQEHFALNGDTVLQRFFTASGVVAVPCFMYISFFYMGDTIWVQNSEKLKQRYIRLYLPVIAWNLIYFTVANLRAVIFRNREMVVGLKSLLKALVFTHVPALADHLWFLLAQILIILLIITVIQYFDNDTGKVCAMVALLIFVFILEYSGVAYYLFATAPYESAAPLGRTIECIPYAIIGVIFSKYINRFDTKRKSLITIAFLLFMICSKRFLPDIEGYGYNGLYLFFESGFICSLCFVIPDIIKDNIKIIINRFGGYTMGVYCLHKLVGTGIELYIPDNTIEGTMYFEMTVFTVSVLLTIVIRMVSKKIGYKWLSYLV